MSTTSVIACTAGYGHGGLGRHLEEVTVALRKEGVVRQCLSTCPAPGDPAGVSVRTPWLKWLFRYTPVRFSHGWQNHLSNEMFDRAASHLIEKSDRFIGFNGQAFHCLTQARKLGTRELALVSANSHVLNVAERHAAALARNPIEGSWLNSAQIKKTLLEYEMADRIYVASEYTRQSFLKRGVPDSKLVPFQFKPHPRFVPDKRPALSGEFRIVNTGNMTVMKGLPVLIEAFEKLDGPKQLTLVGGTNTRGMHRYVQGKLATNPQIQLLAGDPLPFLRQAHVYVHPSFEDGFGYAPAEALACGVPIIVTEDTGMKERIKSDRDGLVIPAGSVETLLTALRTVRERLHSK